MLFSHMNFIDVLPCFSTILEGFLHIYDDIHCQLRRVYLTFLGAVSSTI